MLRVLITYVTKTGTTKRAAQIIAEVLEKREIYTTTMPLDSVDILQVFDAVIIGGPIYDMKWHPDAQEFIDKNEDELKTLDVSFFAMSYVCFLGRSSLKEKMYKTLNNTSKSIKPKAIGILKGKIDKPFVTPAEWVLGIPKDSPLDIQDDDHVRAWAEEWVALHQ